MNAKPETNIMTQVVQVLLDHGPMKVADMMNHITGVEQKSVHNKCLELEKLSLLTRDADDVWSLREGVTAETLTSGELKGSKKPAGAAPAAPSTPAAPPVPPPPPVPKSAGAPLDQQQMFMSHLVGIGVSPKEAIPTITDIFFSGDISSLTWLNQVLQKEAMGFITQNQRRLIVSWWAHTRGLPYKDEDFPILEEEAAKGKKAAPKEEPKKGAAKLMEDAGIGWKVIKDKDGDWVAVPGGIMTQEEATAAAERRATIAAMSLGGAAATAEEPAEGGEGKPVPRAPKAPRSFQDIFMEKAVDHFFDEKKGRGDEDSPQMKALSDQVRKQTETIERMREEREQEWRDRVDANIAEIASRDPWSDPGQVARIRQAIGYQPPGVTDSSPAVQLLKDATDKMDKNVNRLTGLVERVVLKGDEFRPEETRTQAEKEAKAGELLGEVGKRQRSTDIRKRAFSQ